MLSKKFRKFTSICLLGLFGAAVNAHPIMAQQPITSANNIAVNSYSDPASAKSGDNSSGNNNVTVTREEIDQMRKTIELLNDRVKELESKLNKENNTASPQPEAAATGVAVASVAPAAVQEQPAQGGQAAKADDAQKSASSILQFFEKTEVSGLVDVYYSYNFNRPVSSTDVLATDNQLHAFDIKHNQLSLNYAKLVLENKPTPDSRLGFRFDLGYGPAADVIHAAEPGGRDTFRYVQQAYLSYLAPIGKGLQIDFGKYSTHHGFEVIETKDNYNYSESFLFTLGIPLYHFGVRANYSFNDNVSVMVGVNNGWNDVIDNNGRKSYSAQLTLKPTKKLTLIQNYTGGPEQPNDKEDWRHLFDTVVTYAATPALSLATNYVYGFDDLKGTHVHWQGIVGYLRYQINDHFAISPRFEFYDDHDGFTSGLKQQLKEFTLTGEHTLKGGLRTRLEYRRDFSDKDFFLKPLDRFVKAQSTLTLGIIYAFSSKQ